jgi:hypothetical protein
MIAKTRISKFFIAGFRFRLLTGGPGFPCQ